MIVLVGVLVSLSTYAQTATTKKQEDAALTSLQTAMEGLAQSERGCGQDTDCVSYPFGDRACGGPSGYVFTSKNNLNLVEIEFLAKQLSNREEAYNRKWGVISICSMEMPPELECKNQVCSEKPYVF